MGAERVVRWGPPALSQVVTDQLWRHGLGSTDAAACARELAAAVGPAARASSLVDLGGCRFLAGDISGALASWQQAITSGQPAPAARALFNLGLLHEHLGLYEDAQHRLEAAEAHGIAPYAALATLARARAQHRAGANDRAVATLARHADRLMERDPESPLLAETLLGLGDVAEHAGQLDRAEQAYRAAVATGDETIGEHASLALVGLLRFIGHDEEAQQIVEDAGLAAADPVVALDRIELLIRLGRFDEAEGVLDTLEPDTLAVVDQFRLATTQIDLGRVNGAIDILEELAGQGAAETRARAAYRLGEVYLAHDMTEPAAAMFGTVRGLQAGYWADKASLVLGDLAMNEGRHRIAAAHWADAASSRIESVSTMARDRLVDAVDAKPETRRGAASEPATEAPLVSSGPPSAELDVPVGDSGPATEAVDMVAILDDEEAVEVDPVLDPIDMPGEITPVAGVLMAIPVADEVDVEVPAEPLGTGSGMPLAPLAAPMPTLLDEVAPAAPAPPAESTLVSESAVPAAPTVIPLRRRSASVAPSPAAAEDVSPATSSQDDDASPAAPASEAFDEPLVIKLGRDRSASETSAVETSAPEPAVIDLRDREDTAANPYAALAPEALEDDPAPSSRNPYAELAPNFRHQLSTDDVVSDDPLAASLVDSEDEPGPSTFSRLA